MFYQQGSKVSRKSIERSCFYTQVSQQYLKVHNELFLLLFMNVCRAIVLAGGVRGACVMGHATRVWKRERPLMGSFSGVW